MLTTGNFILDNSIKNEIASSQTLKSNHQVTAEWNYNAYIEMDEIGCYTTNAVNSTQYDDGVQLNHYSGTAIIEKDIKRSKYTPLRDIFKINRPKPGIVNSVYSSVNSSSSINGDADPLTISRVFNLTSEDTRLYPMSLNSQYRYWNSARTIDGTLYGVSATDRTIAYAAPFIKYKEDINVNKISIKTQKHLGYPEEYRVDVFNTLSGNWETVYEIDNTYSLAATSYSYNDGYLTIFDGSFSNKITALDQVLVTSSQTTAITGNTYLVSSAGIDNVKIYIGPDISTQNFSTITISQVNLADGVLDIYYNPADQSWGRYTAAEFSPNEKTVTDFSVNAVGTKKIAGVRFVATKMSAPNIPLEVIEISPRLVADLTNNVMSFNVSSSVGQSSYGLPIGTIVSSSGSLSLSNTDLYFSRNNPDSILKDILKPNVEVKLYQLMTIEGVDYRFPLKTLYTDVWDDAQDFSVSVNLEDYFKFFKEMSAPDIMIANQSGVRTSVALLMLMDNIGFNDFRFFKTSNDADYEDTVLDFFYCKKEQTVLEVIDSIAVSTQTSISMSVDNHLVAITKEKMLSSTTKDFWMIGNNGVEQQDGINYIANISSFKENSEPPVTDINVQYTGIGLEKAPMQLIDMPLTEQKDILEGATFGASLVNRDLKLTSDVVWKAGATQDTSNNTLGSASLIRTIPATKPMTFFQDQKTVFATNKQEAIRAFYKKAGAENILSIYLDKEYINTFTNSLSGYVLVDNELIRYTGIKYLIFDPTRKISQHKILFTKEEYAYERSKLAQGGSIEPECLVVHLEFLSEDNDELTKNFTLISDGRNQKNTSIAEHIPLSSATPFLLAHPEWTKFGVHLYGAASTITNQIINGLTVTDKIDTKVSNASIGQTGNTTSYPGYLKISSAKSSISNSIKSTISESASVVKRIPMSNVSEQIITGIFKSAEVDGVAFNPRRIGTRMRLQQDVSRTANASTKAIVNGITAGLAFNINIDTTVPGLNTFTGYVLEVEDVGTIDANSLGVMQFRNLRLYKVYGANHKTKLIGDAWVDVTSTPNETIDFASSVTDGKSMTVISDIEIIINDKGTAANGGYRYYTVCWEGQEVLDVREKLSDAGDLTSKFGLITRGPSSAIYEYVYAFSAADDVEIKLDNTAFPLPSASTSLAVRGLLPPFIKQATETSGVDYKGVFSDFGKLVREVKKMDVRYDMPSLNPKVISLSGYNPAYYVSDFTTSSFGGSFWLYNTANAPIKIDETTMTPLWIAAFPLKTVQAGTLQSSKHIEIPQEDKELNDIYDINRSLYGKQELLLSGAYINNFVQAKQLAEWVILNLSKERKTLQLSIFPNPILELGDKIGVLYSDKLYADTNKTYTITSISHEISNSGGPQTTIELKECI